MQDRLESFGGSGPSVLFAHANGYPPGSYRQFIGHLLPYCQLTGYRHRPMWGDRHPPKRLNWSLFADDLIHTVESTLDQPAWMMGHSMGGVVALMAAERRPELFKGLILIDPVFMPSRRVFAMGVMPSKRKAEMPMVRRALGRPDHFASHEEAFTFYRGKRAFGRFSDEVLWDYVHASKSSVPEGGVQLSFPAAWEAAVYGSAPWVWPRLLRVRLPTLGLRGEHSDVLTPGAMRRWARLQPSAELHHCPGGHLLPMELPETTAGYVIDFLQRHLG